MRAPSWLWVGVPVVALGLGFTMGSSCEHSRMSRESTRVIETVPVDRGTSGASEPAGQTTTTGAFVSSDRATNAANAPAPAQSPPPTQPSTSLDTRAEPTSANAAPANPSPQVVVQVQTPQNAQPATTTVSALPAVLTTPGQAGQSLSASGPASQPSQGVAQAPANGTDAGNNASPSGGATAPSSPSAQDPSLTSGAYSFGSSGFGPPASPDGGP